VKHYFLLDQGDFIVQFMDMAEHEMKKPMEGMSCCSSHTQLQLGFLIIIIIIIN